MNKNTITYYNTNAKEYFDQTSNINMQSSYDEFLKYLKRGSYILDFGCGSGRDSKYFLDNGYKIKCIDASKKLCSLASSYLLQEVTNMEFIDLDDKNMFDGIWACASLLHITKKELLIVIKKMIESLKEEGYIYISLKDGTGEEIDSKGRFNAYYTKKDLYHIFSLYPELKVISFFDNEPITNSKESKKWNNLVLKKIVVQ